MMLRSRGDRRGQIEDAGRVAADDELQEHLARLARESLAAVRRARELQHRQGSRPRLIVMMIAVAAVVAGVLLFRRSQAQQQGDSAYQDSRGADRSREAGAAAGWKTPTPPMEETPDPSEAPTAPQPVIPPEPDAATERR
jgi:hypothetical protein